MTNNTHFSKPTFNDPSADPLGPRLWHYQFVHYGLRSFAMQESREIFDILADPERAKDFFAVLLQAVAKNAGLDGHYVKGIAATVRVTPSTIGGYQSYIVALPEPMQMGECHFVAIVREPSGAGFFTLEKSLGDTAMLCAWEKGGRHVNFGPTQARSVDAFAAAVTQNL